MNKIKENNNQRYIHDISQLSNIDEETVRLVFQTYRYVALHYMAVEQDPNRSTIIFIPYFIPIRVHVGKENKVFIKVPPWVRHKYFKQISAAMLDKRDFLAEMMCKEIGKSVATKIREFLYEE